MVENLAKRRQVKLLRSWKEIGKISSVSCALRSPRSKSFSIFGENLVSVELKQNKLVYDRPWTEDSFARFNVEQNYYCQ